MSTIAIVFPESMSFAKGEVMVYDTISKVISRTTPVAVAVVRPDPPSLPTPPARAEPERLVRPEHPPFDRYNVLGTRDTPSSPPSKMPRGRLSQEDSAKLNTAILRIIADNPGCEASMILAKIGDHPRAPRFLSQLLPRLDQLAEQGYTDVSETPHPTVPSEFLETYTATTRGKNALKFSQPQSV